MKLNLSVLTALTVALITLNSCGVMPEPTAKKKEHQPYLASLRVNNRAGNGKEATRCVVWSIDGKKVAPGQDFVFVRPGTRSVAFTYQKWCKDSKRFTSLRPIQIKGQMKPGGIYWLDAKTLGIEPAEGPCSAMVTDDRFVYAMRGRAEIRQMP